MENQTTASVAMENAVKKVSKKKSTPKKVVAKKASKKAAKKVAKKKQANQGNIKAKVIKFLQQGKGPTEAARLANCSLTTARYHAKRLGGVAKPNVKTQVIDMSKITLPSFDKLQQKVDSAQHEANEAAAARDEYAELAHNRLIEIGDLKKKIKLLRTMLLEELAE